MTTPKEEMLKCPVCKEGAHRLNYIQNPLCECSVCLLQFTVSPSPTPTASWEEEFEKQVMGTSALAGLTGGRKNYVKLFIKNTVVPHVQREERRSLREKIMKLPITMGSPNAVSEKVWRHDIFALLED